MEFMKQHRRALYIALALCVVAAGVTGYLVTNRKAPTQQASANQPVVDVKPPVVTPVKPDLPVLIAGDRKASLGAGIELLARLKASGIGKASFQVRGSRE